MKSSAVIVMKIFFKGILSPKILSNMSFLPYMVLAGGLTPTSSCIFSFWLQTYLVSLKEFYMLFDEKKSSSSQILCSYDAKNLTSVKMETLCRRFFADISVTGGHINMGSSRECLELKN